MHTARRLLAVAGCGLTLAGCGGERPLPPAGSASAVLIVVDTLRWDRLGANGGGSRVATHNMDLLAGLGVRFSRAYTPSPWTKPAVASLLTGLYPSGHGANSVDAGLPASAVTLAERLRESGWATGAVVSGQFVTTHHGMNQGFDSFDEEFVLGHTAITSRSVTDRALQFARESHGKGRPYFLFAHYFDAHYAYRDHPGIELAPAERGRLRDDTSIHRLREWAAAAPDGDALTQTERDALGALYDEEILFLDGALGRLLKGLDEISSSAPPIVLLTADHGEELAERGWIGHTRTLYEEVLRVPLLIRAPGRGAKPGSVVDAPVSTVAVAPTLLDLLGVAAGDARFQAQSLLPWLEGRAPAEPDVVIGEVDFRAVHEVNTPKTAFKKALVEERFKLVRDDPTGAVELYDLDSDPFERDNLARQDPERAARMRGVLEEKLAALREGAEEAAAVEVDAGERERLRELGYLGD